jgi:hypothetical protein
MNHQMSDGEGEREPEGRERKLELETHEMTRKRRK